MGGFGMFPGEMSGVPDWLWPALLRSRPELLATVFGGTRSPTAASSGGVPGVPAEPVTPASPGGVPGAAAEPSAAGAAASTGGGYRKVEVPQEWPKQQLEAATAPPPKPTRLQSFADLAGPIMQILASAFAGPSRGHRFGRPFLGAALGGGGAALQMLAGRPQAKWQQRRAVGQQNLGTYEKYLQATRPIRAELREVQDTQTGKTGFATPEQIQANPGRFTPIPKAQAERNAQVQIFNVEGVDRPFERNPKTGEWEPVNITVPPGPELNPATTGPNRLWMHPFPLLSEPYNPDTAGKFDIRPTAPPELNPATTGANQFWLPGAFNPETAGKFVVHPSVPTRVRALAPKKFETLDQEYAAAVEARDAAKQDSLLKAMRKKAVATHISEPKGPTAREVADQRKAEAFDAAGLLLEQVDPKVKASGDPRAIYNASLRELYRRTAQPGVSARAKAQVGDVERELYRQSGAGLRTTPTPLSAQEMADEIGRVNSNPYLSEEEKNAKVDQLLKTPIRK